MKYCPECGAALPGDAKFCSRCGKPQQAPPPEAGQAPAGEQWETCEIVAVAAGEKWSPVFPGDYIIFRAQAETAEESRTVRESERVAAGLGDYYQANKGNKRHAAAVAALAAALAGDGWDRAGRGDAWYSLRFRRRQSQVRP